MAEKILAKFTRETRANEDMVVHREGDTAEMSQEQFIRWQRRGAVMLVSEAKAAAKAAAKA